MLNEETKEEEGDDPFDDLRFDVDEIVPEDGGPVGRPARRSTVFDPAEWQERTGWENHLIEKATRPTFDDPERSAMGLILQRLVEWK